ncbi:prolyl oligopeptidase family serine peptidase [Allomuricauda sp. SCSIO 65647]|uniref:carboxylesterase family protein n=1 Tax=Allomuricauda sp. SCSIO 65647 TaxID=2908843 RepID=UPI001F39F82A|nr:prolyl oligopeptidase family serine peptidase [Muricauda sp. SCSIO 65647]UJH68008.1 prolyl oligopeptidase family serine peptidase [Muricauda sp. SCSIO 65647]
MKFFSLILMLLAFSVAIPQDSTMYVKKVFEMDGGALPYRLLLPKDYDEEKDYPLILFLHGSGERGNDNMAQLVHGSSLFLKDDVREKYPAIVVFPQCAANSSWAKTDVRGQWGNREFVFYQDAEPTNDLLLLEGLLKYLKRKYPVDKNRMYVGGLSMGGMGTFELVNRNPRMFAAAFPICGGANPNIAKRLKKVYWWVFHGEADNVVPPKYSTQMVDALQDVGAEVKYSLYPDVGHDSWNNAFAEPGLLSWLFSKSK